MRILLVEDETDAAAILAKGLREQSYAVDIAADGNEALEKAAVNEYDLIILDIMLPDLDGNAVCQELRRRYHSWEVPVLMLTARTKPVDQLRGFAHGADAYMTKPYNAQELLSTVAQLLEEPGAVRPRQPLAVEHLVVRDTDVVAGEQCAERRRSER